MDKTTLLIIIGASVFVLLVAFIVIVRINNRKRFKRLQENLKKYKLENEEFDNNDKISLPKEDVLEETYLTNDQIAPLQNIDKEAIIEDYMPDENLKFDAKPTPNDDLDFSIFDKQPNPTSNDFYSSNSKIKDIKDDDFENFMNEHSYSRKVFNKPLIEKIKDLPSDVRMLLLSNVFDRWDEDKK